MYCLHGEMIVLLRVMSHFMLLRLDKQHTRPGLHQCLGVLVPYVPDQKLHNSQGLWALICKVLLQLAAFQPSVSPDLPPFPPLSGAALTLQLQYRTFCLGLSSGFLDCHCPKVRGQGRNCYWGSQSSCLVRCHSFGTELGFVWRGGYCSTHSAETMATLHTPH